VVGFERVGRSAGGRGRRAWGEGSVFGFERMGSDFWRTWEEEGFVTKPKLVVILSNLRTSIFSLTIAPASARLRRPSREFLE